MDHEPTQYEIDQLIEGRELIDACKAVKSQCVKVLLNHDTVMKSTTLVKPGKTEPLDRPAVAITSAEAVIYRNDRLKEMRFDIESFAKFNREMVVAEVQWHMFKIIHVCDMCRGYDGTPPCRITCGDKSWNARKPNRQIELEKANSIFIKDDVFFQWIQQIEYDKSGHATMLYPDLDHDGIAKRLGFDLTREYEVDGVLHIAFGGCPDGHGLISQYQGPARFDLHWTMDLMREVPRLYGYNTLSNI